MTGPWPNIGAFECLFLAFVVAAVLGVLLLAAFLVSRSGRGAAHATSASPHETALDVLRRRLAAGEITPEQFDELRRRIEQ